MEILKLLKNKNTREEIIEDFGSFITSDDDMKVLYNYIDHNLKNYLYIEDSYELSILSNYVTRLHYTVAAQALFKRNSYFLKLSILDFLLISINEKKTTDDFLTINTIACNNNNNNIVSFQAKLNLLCVDSKGIQYFLDNRTYTSPSLYYRLINSLENSRALKSVFFEYIDDVKINIEKKEDISVAQKKELIERINKLYSKV